MRRTFLLALALLAVAAGPGVASVTPDPFRIGAGTARVAFVVPEGERTDVAVRVRHVRSGRVVRRWVLRRAAPGRRVVRWDGRTASGRFAPDGRHEAQVAVGEGRFRRVGRLTVRAHAFPVLGRTGSRGAIGRFGAPRTGGRTHEGYDVVAPCGRPVVAAHAGRARVSYDPRMYGHLVRVRDRRTGLETWYSHLLPRVRVRHGERVAVGRRLGVVGDTGNARSVGCHLHFEVRRRGRPVDPAPLLTRWRRAG